MACQAVARNASEGWWAHKGSNLGPLPCEGNALPLSYAPGRLMRRQKGAIYEAGGRGVKRNASDDSLIYRRRNLIGRPCERRGPYAAASLFWGAAERVTLLSKPVVMGPCVRRDDGGIGRTQAIAHHLTRFSP